MASGKASLVIKTKLDNKRLKTIRRGRPKFLVLLSNDVVVIDTEFEALAKAKRLHPTKRVVEMYKLKRKNRKSEVTTLTKMLEANEEKSK